MTDRITPIDGVDILVAGRHGTFLVNRYDAFLGGSLLKYGEYSEEEARFLAGVIPQGGTVIEVGANIGLLTIPIAKAVGTSGVVVAVEPQPAIYRYLLANVARNGLGSIVETVNAGCGRERGTLFVPEIDYGVRVARNSGAVSLTAEKTGIPVDIVTVDEIAEGRPRVDMIKVDVEGMEEEVLAGATETITRHRPLLYVENDRAAKSRSLIESILAHSYRLWWHGPALFNPENFFGDPENIFERMVSFNMICIPVERTEEAGGPHEITDPTKHPFLDRLSASPS